MSTDEITFSDIKRPHYCPVASKRNGPSIAFVTMILLPAVYCIISITIMFDIAVQTCTSSVVPQLEWL